MHTRNKVGKETAVVEKEDVMERLFRDCREGCSVIGGLEYCHLIAPPHY